MGENETDAPYFDLNLGKTVDRRALSLQQRRELTFVRRGMGKTGITHRPMTDAEKMTICMLYGQGLTDVEIGEKVSRSANSIRSVLHQVKKFSKTSGCKIDWREDLKEKSVQAIRAGLVHPKDPYKAAGIGVQTLKGLGEFESEGQVHIAALLNGIPEGQRDRYVSLDTSNAIDIEGTEVPEVPDPAPDAPPVEDEPLAEPPAEIPEPEKEPER